MKAITRFWAPSEEDNHFVGVLQVNGLVPNLTKGSSVHINEKGLYWVVCVETTTLRSGKEDIIGQYVYLRPNPPKKKKRWFFL